MSLPRPSLVRFVVALSAVAAVALLAATLAPRALAAEAKPGGGSAAERGAYLVTIGSCNDCHTPWKMGAKGPEPDMTRMLSGHPAGVPMPAPPKPQGPWVWSGAGSMTAFAGPWGISYAANLTPDPDTGLGAWDEQRFISAIRTGQHLGIGRPILPPMPWPNVAKMTDADLKAVFAYLKTIPPIKNEVPDAVVAEPPAH
jgi:mono/diheme cytochrome c family protein